MKKIKQMKNNSTWKRIFLYSSKYKFQFILSALLALPEAVVNIIGPKLSGQLMDILSEGVCSAISGGGMDFNRILQLLVFLFVIYSLFLVCSCISGYLVSNISIGLTYELRREVSEKIYRLSLKYFSKESYGEVTSRITNDVDALVSSLTQIFSKLISSILVLFGIVYMMFSISWQMTIVSFLGTPIGFIFVFILINSAKKYFRDYRIQLGKMTGYIEEVYEGHSVVKAFSGERTAIQKFNKLNSKMYHIEWKAGFLSSFVSPIMELVSSLTYIVLCVMGGYLAMTGIISIGDIFAFLAYSNQFAKPLSAVTGITGTLQEIFSAAQRIFEFLDEEEVIDRKEDIVNILDGKYIITTGREIEIKGDVEFKNLRFGYDDEKLVVKDFSLKVKSGENIAIVGYTGAGKTTITKLLMGFYPLKAGQILIDGYDITSFKRKDLYSLFGTVFQEPWLFNETIMENIRYGKMNSTDEEVKEAAKLACADSFINSLPDGYETIINESSDNISHGEKQLLTIARAIIAKHKILILDEATASVDTRTEARIQKGLKNLMKGMTSFVIAHRLSTIRYADMIVVIDNGGIAEQGTHEELMMNKGLYYKMYTFQFKNGVIE